MVTDEEIRERAERLKQDVDTAADKNVSEDAFDAEATEIIARHMRELRDAVEKE